MWQFVSDSPGDTESLGRILGQLLEAGDILALSGPLGAGKTCLARGILRGLGVKGYVRSPSFGLVHPYKGRLPAYHWDVYRLEGPGEMDDLDYEEYFYGEGVTLLEWPERVQDILPGEVLWITMKIKGPSRRDIILDPRGCRYRRLVEEVSRLACSGA